MRPQGNSSCSWQLPCLRMRLSWVLPQAESLSLRAEIWHSFLNFSVKLTYTCKIRYLFHQSQTEPAVAWISLNKAFLKNDCYFFYSLTISHLILSFKQLRLTPTILVSLACLLKVSSKFHIEQEQPCRELEPNLVKSIEKNLHQF